MALTQVKTPITNNALVTAINTNNADLDSRKAEIQAVVDVMEKFVIFLRKFETLLYDPL